MPRTLQSRRVERLPELVRLQGRILFLAADAALVRSQLEGQDLAWTPAIGLRDNISTDEITPAYICYYYDETLGDFPYLGLKCGEEFPITRASVKRGGFVASVSGKRRGKGSSREQSPYAEMCAGIKLVIAENIERIYRENCQNLGVLTTTDFSIIERVQRGEAIPLAAFTQGEGEITRGIIEYGGLFNFNVARLQGKVILARPDTAPRPMTLGEKILARHWVVDPAQGKVGVPAVKPGDEGFVVTDIRFSHEYVTPMAAIFFEQLVGKDEQVSDPASILMFRDHLTFLPEAMTPERVKEGLLDVALQLEKKQRAFAAKQGIKLYGELRLGHHGSEAICHSKILEGHAEPGMVIIGSDSHTPHAGAVGCVAFGVGTTAIFNSWITKDVRLTVPETVKVVVRGSKPDNVTAKDFMLEVLRHPYVKSGQAIGKLVEYCGDAVESLSVDERATMTNMTAEVGGFTGYVAPDAKTVEYLVEYRGMSRAEAARRCAGLASDRDAEYCEVIELDAGAIRPMMALPGDPGNGQDIGTAAQRIRVDIAYAGSCTAGKKEDMDMYARVLAEAAERGARVAPWVRFYIQCGSQDVKRYCEERGYLELFQKVGATFLEPSCGACINAGPGVSKTRDEVTISAINRNFPGRSGPGQLYLANPYTVAASAITGYITEWQAGMALAPAE
ncbi:MAG: 3-isopropylmalate dehydratase [Gemmatimonadetes bacterium]|nr:MAG: 3-isopropylmalate dehydratase [Gemmatimonadetes bacterium 13_1_20CM_4_69_16]PYO13877.1 MAG: 3-isopropylmalate dehydratase [Gemmatimonadota bacterium]